MITDSAGENGDNLAVACHLGSEENDGDEYEQRAEHIHKIGYKIDVIVKNDFFEWGLILKEVIHFFGEVEDNGNTHYQHNGEEKCAEKLLDDVFVDGFQ